MSTTTSGEGHAIVIGASIAGLLAARALAERYEAVTLLERDRLPAIGERRKGVPQGRHTHGLLASGRAALEELLPGLTAELVDRGALSGDTSALLRWYHAGVCHAPSQSGLVGLLVSRPTLEGQVRARVLALPNVRAIEGCDVLGLTATPYRSRITGVRLLRRAAGSAAEELPADLVVDAAGRGSRSPAWLAELGYAPPPTEELKVGMGYTTCLYRRVEGQLSGITGIIVAATPRNPRSAAMLAQEGGTWIVSIGGYQGDHAPLDHAGFIEFARRLPTGAIYEAIRGLEPLGAPVPFRYPASVRRRYERLTRFPDGYLVLGDALCSFNPVYGQGMTVAAHEALALREALRGGEGGLARRFFAAAARVIDIPWSLVLGSDQRIPGVGGRQSAAQRAINWYIDRLHIAAQGDPAVALAFLRVLNMLAPPPSLLRPGMALRVLRGNLRRAPLVAGAPATLGAGPLR